MKSKFKAPKGYQLIPRPKNPGRKPILKPCEWCKQEFGVVAMRVHIPTCPKRKR